MFEAGRLVARIALEGAATVGRELAQVRSEFGKLDNDGRRASEEVGRSLLGVGVGITALAGVAVAKFASFDKAFSQVRANVQGSPADFAKLKEAAIDAGQTSVYTAEEAAGAQAELAKAGVKTADILGGGLAGSLALAAAGQIDVGEAAEVAATAMTQFGLAGSKVPHIADLLAAAANTAQGGVGDMGAALKQSGLVASQFGLSLEETVGTLTAFAAGGLLGSDAGTSFRTMLLSLAKPSAEAKEALKKYNIEAYNSQGQFVGTIELQKQLRAGFEGASDAERQAALTTIFGSDAIRAASLLYKDGGKSVADYTKEIDRNNAASDMASDLQDNLAGDVEKLGGAFDSLFIGVGAGANGPLRDLVQVVTEVVTWFGNLPEPLQQTFLLLGLVGGGAITLGGGLLYAVPKVLDLADNVNILRERLPTLDRGLRGTASFLTGPWGLALGTSVALLGIAAQMNAEYESAIDDITASLDENSGALTENTRKTVAKQLQDKGIFDTAKQLGLSLDTVTDAALGQADAMDEVQAATDKYNKKIGDGTSLTEAFWSGLGGSTASNFANDVTKMSDRVKESNDRFKEQKEAVEGADAAQTEATEGTQDAAAAYDDVADSTAGYADQLAELIKAVRDYNDLNISAGEAQIKYADNTAQIAARLQELRDGVEGVSAGLTAASDGFDLNTEAGRENYGMILDQAQAAQALADKNYEISGSAEAYRTEIEGARGALTQQLIDFGLTATAAQAIVDKILAIPPAAATNYQFNTGDSISKLDGIIGRISTIKNTGPLKTGYVFQQAEGSVRSFANGGEHHVAQIAKAGEWRVWAEDETGGEAYIPLAPSKRGRSLSILGDVAGRFGYALVPAGATRAADGLVSGGGSVPTIVNEFNGPIGYDPNEIIRRQRQGQQRALNRAGIDSGSTIV